MECAQVNSTWSHTLDKLPACKEWDSHASEYVSNQVASEKLMIHSAIRNGVGIKKYYFEGKYTMGSFEVFKYNHCKNSHALLFRLSQPAIVLNVKLEHEPIVGGKSIATGSLLSGATPVSQVYRAEDTIRAKQLRDVFHTKLIDLNMGVTKYTRVILCKGETTLRGNTIVKPGAEPQKYGKWPELPRHVKGQQRITTFFKKKGMWIR